MGALGWIIFTGILMSGIAMVGSITLILKENTLQKIQTPLVAFSAGSLIGGSFLHMIPVGLTEYAGSDSFFLWILTGFTCFLPWISSSTGGIANCRLNRPENP